MVLDLGVEGDLSVESKQIARIEGVPRVGADHHGHAEARSVPVPN
jgi:hypothetical protein